MFEKPTTLEEFYQICRNVNIIQSLTKTLRTRGKGINKTPGICGGEACIAGTRIAVWLLVEAQQLGIS